MNHSNPLSEKCEFTAQNESATDALGNSFAEVLESGLVVNLVGNLGAGKTRFVRSLATALGIDGAVVSSPTFVLHQEYEGAGGLLIHHFDAYRLRDQDEFLEIGAAELLGSRGVCFIEWGDRVQDVLPRDLLRIEIETTGETARKFLFMGSGARSNAAVVRLRAKLSEDRIS